MSKYNVAQIQQFTGCAPAQWEGTTLCGKDIYIRYRGGRLTVGIGETFDDAVDDMTFQSEIGMIDDGWLSTEDMMHYTKSVLNWQQDSNMADKP